VKQVKYFLSLVWLYPIIGLAFLFSNSFRSYRQFHSDIWKEVKENMQNVYLR